MGALEINGWLAKVTMPGTAKPRYFVVAIATAEEAELIIKHRRDARRGQVEILCRIDIPNVMGFTLARGEARPIDYDTPETP
jgi:hypothetical protein